jgi:hypothetical protein
LSQVLFEIGKVPIWSILILAFTNGLNKRSNTNIVFDDDKNDKKMEKLKITY